MEEWIDESAKFVWGAATYGRFTFLPLLLCTPLYAASLAGIWIGDSKKDPITDRPYSLAMTYDKADAGTIALRCKNGALDILVSPTSPQFTVGARQRVALRFDKSEPLMLDAIATEPEMLVLDHKRDVNVLLPFMTAKTIAVRFSGTYGRDYTMQLLSALPPNALSMVGRVLADCDVTSYPQEQIDKVAAEMTKAVEQERGSARAKKLR